MEAGGTVWNLCYQLFSSKYISRDINICSVKNSETPLNDTNEISDNEDNFDKELPTQQNDIEMRTLVSILVIILQKIKMSWMKTYKRKMIKLIMNSLYDFVVTWWMMIAMLVLELIYWISLTLGQWQYTFTITENALESLIKLFSNHF